MPYASVVLCALPLLARFFFRQLSRMGYAGCSSLVTPMRQRCIVRHNMPVVLLGGIFATVPLFGVIMRYTIPPLFFVNYVGIVSRHRHFRATNSYVPRCPVCVISVSAECSIFVCCFYFCYTLRKEPPSRPSDEREMTERRARQKMPIF